MQKIVFLSRALAGEDHNDRIGVNCQWSLQMNPHGKRLMRQGYFTMERSPTTGRKKGGKRQSYLVITSKGRKEYARLTRIHKLSA